MSPLLKYLHIKYPKSTPKIGFLEQESQKLENCLSLKRHFSRKSNQTQVSLSTVLNQRGITHEWEITQT